MLDLRKRIFISFSIVVLGILALVLVLMALNADPQEPQPDTDNTSTPPVQQDADQGNTSGVVTQPPAQPAGGGNAPAVDSEPSEERYVRQLAINFVERFGSYSNQNRNAHIDDVLPLVTPTMAAWVETQKEAYSTSYEGSTTNVIVSRVDSLEDTQATVHIEAQQTIETQDEEERLYHVGRVELVSIDGQWQVDGLYWE